jgi:SSS family solute:Na+ symporter
MVTLLAAAMSTLSALFHTMGTAIGHDIWGQWKGRKPSLMENRVGVLAMLVVSLALAFVMPGNIIARATAMFMGLCAAAFLPAFVHALFSKKVSTKAAIASLVVGSVTWFLWTGFVHKAESSVLGLSQLLFGQPAVLGMPWQVVDPLIIALPLSAVTLAFVWALDKEVKSETTAKQANT